MYRATNAGNLPSATRPGVHSTAEASRKARFEFDSSTHQVLAGHQFFCFLIRRTPYGLALGGAAHPTALSRTFFVKVADAAANHPVPSHDAQRVVPDPMEIEQGPVALKKP